MPDTLFTGPPGTGPGARAGGARSPMLPGARFEADVVLVAPREFEINTAQKTYREKSNTTFTELLSVNAFQTHYIKRINEALGLEALAAYLEADGRRTAILNCNVAPHTPEEIAEKIRRSGARVVGISLIYRPQVDFAIRLLEALRPLDHVRVFMGGALASYMPRELLSCLARLDGVVYGEAEETFRDVAGAVLDDGAWWTEPGLICRLDGKVVRNPPALPLDLGEILAPTRKTLDFLRSRGWPTRIASIYTSRGCMAKCTFCTGKDAYNVERLRTYRFRDPIAVADEITHLATEYGVGYVYINDDNFLGYGKASAERIRTFAEEMIRRDLGVRFASECRVDGLDVELLRLLKQAGMEQALLGLETGSDPVLKRWRKGATVAQNKAAIRTLEDVGIPLEPGFILFDAHTSAWELRDNAGFLRSTGLTETQFPHYLVNRLAVYPGTEIEWTLRAEGVLPPSPIPAGGPMVDRPDLVRAYFASLVYTCRDPRAEIAWRALRAAVEPVEMFVEDRLPTLMAVLTRVRGRGVDPALVARSRELIRLAGRWRRRIGTLIVDMIEACADSFETADAPAQMRTLRRRLADMHDAYVAETLGMDYEAFTDEVVRINRVMTPYEISVVVPSAGKWSRLRRTLQSLAAQRFPDGARWEVVLVLDGVPGAPPDGLVPDGLDLKTVRNVPAVGRGGARNRGIAAAQGEFVLLVDDDIVFGPDLVQAHLSAQRQRSALYRGPLRELMPLACLDDLDAGALTDAARATGKHDRIAGLAATVLNAVDADPDGAWSAYGRPNRIERDGSAAYAEGRMEVAWVAFAGANLSAPRRWLADMPFDDRPGTRWGLEDVALALRFLLHGYPLAELPAARACHLSHQRHGWRDSQALNAMCLDFLDDPETAETVVAYLAGTADAAAVGDRIAGVLHRARVYGRVA